MAATDQLIRTDSLSLRNRSIRVRRGGHTQLIDLSEAPRRQYELSEFQEPVDTTAKTTQLRRRQSRRTTQLFRPGSSEVKGKTVKLVDDLGVRYVAEAPVDRVASVGDSVVYVQNDVSTSLFWIQSGAELVLAYPASPDPTQLFQDDGNGDVTPESIFSSQTDPTWEKDGDDLIV